MNDRKNKMNTYDHRIKIEDEYPFVVIEIYDRDYHWKIPWQLNDDEHDFSLFSMM